MDEIKIYIICDYRENYDGIALNDHIYNDHASKNSVEAIKNSIINLGYNCEIIGGTKELIQHCNLNKIPKEDIYINLSDGTDHLHGRVQPPLISELYDLKYSGANALQAAIANNKHFSKLFVNDLGIKTPKGISLQQKDKLSLIAEFEGSDFPLIVKPNCMGSSIGIDSSSICNNVAELKKQIKKLRGQYKDIIVERYIAGYEITNFIIGNGEENPINDIITFSLNDNFFLKKEVFGYIEKFKKLRKLHADCEYISEALSEKIKANSLKIKNTLSVNDIIRIDYRITKENDIYFIEMNTVPRVSITSEIGTICSNRNLKFIDFIKLYVKTIISRVN